MAQGIDPPGAARWQDDRVTAPATRLVLIRHGHAQAAVDGIVAGHRACRGLSELGKRQVEALRVRLSRTRELRADALYTSVLPRAIETAEALAAALGSSGPMRDCDLCELHPGEADGMPWDAFWREHGFDMRSEPERPMSPGGESLAGFQRRVEQRLAEIVRAHRGESVVIVCHGGVISAASLAFMEHGYDRVRPFRLDPENASITEWARPAGEDRDAPWLLVRYNDAGHLHGLDGHGT
jgi:probable phosphoglycerate mutase